MTASEIAAHLFQACGTLSDFDAYMFGSTLHGIGVDIDILIVGLPGDELTQLKEELRIAGQCLPLHLLVLQPSEVERTDFIRRTHCVWLASLATCEADPAAVKTTETLQESLQASLTGA